MSYDKAQLIKIYNPFNRTDKDIIPIPCDGTQSLLNIKQKYFPEDISYVVSLNGRIVQKEHLPTTFPCEGDYILFVPEIQGGGGGGKTILRAVMMIGIAVAAPYAAAAMGFVTAAGALSTTGMIVAGGITVAGGLMVNFMLPPPKPKIPTMDSLSGNASQTYSWGPQTVQQQGVSIAEIYGQNKVYGNIFMGYNDIVDQKQYACVAVGLGIGELASITDVKINDQDETSFKGVDVQKYVGKMDQEALNDFEWLGETNTATEQLLGVTKTEYAMSVEISNKYEEYIYTTIGNNYDALEVVVMCPALFQSDDEGNVKTTDVTMKLEIQKVGDATWYPFTHQVASASPETIASDRWSLGRYVHEQYKAGKEVWEEIQTSTDDKSGTPEVQDIGLGGEDNPYIFYYWRYLKAGKTIRKCTKGSLTKNMTNAAAKTSAVYLKYNVRIPTDRKGQHKIKVIRQTDSHKGDIKYSDRTYLNTVKEIIKDKFTYPRLAYVAIKALATNQLSGSLRFSCIVKGKKIRRCTSLSPETWTYGYSNNPAWVAYNIATQPVFDNSGTIIRYDNMQPAQLDTAAFKAWADYCDSTVYDGETKALTTTGSDTTHIILQSGGSLFAEGDKILIDPTGGTAYQGKDDETQVPVIQSIASNTMTISPALSQAPGSGVKVLRGEKRCTFNGIFDTEISVWDAILQVCQVGRAIPVWNGTKLTISIDKKKTPVQMFTVGNIGKDSFKESFLSTSERAAEIEINFINKKNDYNREPLSVYNSNLTTKTNKAALELFGINKASEAWRAGMLRLYKNQYVVRSIETEQDVDAIACTVGDCVNIQHDVPQWGEGGRLVSATASSVTLDKSVTIEAAKTYKVAIRLNDDTLVERTVTDGAGTYTTLNITPNFSSVPVQYNPYAFGEDGIVTKPFIILNFDRTHDQKCRLEAAEYIEGIYDLVDYGDPLIKLTNYSSLDPIAKVSNLALKEISAIDSNGQFTQKVQVSWDPPTNNILKYVKLYYKEYGVDNEYTYWGQTDHSPYLSPPVKSATTYEIKVVGVNLFGIEDSLSEAPSATITITSIPTSINNQMKNGITGLQIFGQGNDTEFGGRDCKFIWEYKRSVDLNLDAGSENTGAGQHYPDPWFKDFKIEIWGILSTDKLPRRTEWVTQNEYNYTLEKNYEDGLVRDFEIRSWARDRFNRLSTNPAILRVTNPAPKMLKADGTTIVPTVRKIKHGNRVSWPHPYNSKGKPEYDLVAFILYCAEDSGFTTNVKKYKIASLVNGFDPTGDISSILYKIEVDGLDPKKTYYYKVVPLDAYSVAGGLPSSVISSIPGLTHDDDENDKPRPAKYDITNLVISAITEINDDGKTVTNLLIKGLKAIEADADGYILEYRTIKNLSAVSAPTGAEVDAGISGSYAVDGDTLLIGIDGEAGTGTTDTNYFKKKIRDIKNNWKYFFRIRTQDTGGNKGEWSEWVTFSTTKDNNASDTTPPSVPYLSLSATTDAIDMTASIASPPADLSGFQFAVKTSAFSGDEASYIHAAVDAAAGKGKVSFYGNVGTTYYVKARSYDNSQNYSSWTTAQTSSPMGVGLDLLSEPFSKWLFDGSFSSSANNKVSWTSGTMKKKKNSGATTNYSISSATNQTITGTRFICFDSAASTTAFQIYTASQYQGSDTAVGVAKVEQTSGVKVNIHRLIGSDVFAVSAYEGGFNVLSAKTADLGTVTTGTIKMSDGSNVRIYQDGTVNPPILRISKAGYNADTETNPNNLLWSSAYNYFKIIDNGNASVTFDAFDGVGGHPSPIAAGSVGEQVVTLSHYGSSSKLAVFGAALFGSAPNDWLRVMPFELYNNADQYQHFEIAYSPSNTSIICARRVFNGATSGTYSPGSITLTVNWYLLAETLS